ncbi:hypothetical protein [Anaerotignum sp.]|uniref:hypothetical protein n=1 Tax=Anaerotignum sp. TaxID=2039241 RepID=UPI003A8828E9
MTIQNYLNEKITNSWYKNAEIDYGITGKFLDCEAVENDLLIIWEEMGEKQELIIAAFTEYTPEQIYNIWMEEA